MDDTHACWEVQAVSVRPSLRVGFRGIVARLEECTFTTSARWASFLPNGSNQGEPMPSVWDDTRPTALAVRLCTSSGNVKPSPCSPARRARVPRNGAPHSHRGGCAESSRPTTHDNPVHGEQGVTHYCSANMPGAYARTVTQALTNVTHRYIETLADHSLGEALNRQPVLLGGINGMAAKSPAKPSPKPTGWNSPRPSREPARVGGGRAAKANSSRPACLRPPRRPSRRRGGRSSGSRVA